jgi:hypothetical protein
MIIDAHVHICPPQVRKERQPFLEGEPEFSGIYSDPRAVLIGAEDLLATMDEQGVDRAVVFGFPWRNQANFRLNNDYVLEAAGRYPDRLIPFCCLHPSHPDTETEIRRCFDLGAKGVGEIAYYSRGLDETARYEIGRAAALCEEADRFLLLHTNEPVGHAYPGKSPMHLGQLYTLLRERPNTRWILAHAGGGLPFYALMKKEVEEVLAGCLFDIAALPFLFKPEGLLAMARAAGPEKFVLGTDFPLLPPKRYYRLLEDSGLSQEEQAMILGGNMERELW